MALVLKTLADPVRLRLVSIIGTAPAGEACACDLPELVDRSQPTVSHHLGQLVKAGILEREQRGKWAWFRINGERLEAVCRALDFSCTFVGGRQMGLARSSGSQAEVLVNPGQRSQHTDRDKKIQDT